MILCDLLRYFYHETKQILIDWEVNTNKSLAVTPNYNSRDPNIFVVTSPEYGNIGDHAICKFMLDYAKTRFPNHRIYEISDSEFLSTICWLKENNKKDDYIWLIGGGNFGNLYIFSEWIRRRVIRACKNATIIMFPQSSVWDNSLYGKLQLRRSSKIYSKNKRLFLMARDKNTFNLLNNYFDNNSFLAPDIVLTSVISNNRKFNNTILMCMRTDIEKSVNPIVENEIKLYLKGKGYDIDVIDTETYSKILRSESEYIVETTIRKFANAHYVVTDRLHGLIFANITGTPCLAIDNKTKKISGFYELWIDKNHNILFDSNISISLQIDKLLILQKYDYSNRASLAAINNIIDQVIGGADK